MKLDFLIAGSQKGGTTALWHFLRQHPSIELAECKEIHFFDDEQLDWSALDYTALHSHFSGRSGVVRGEATPIYLYWQPSLRRIQAYHPAIRLIFIFRDPVMRAWSQWRMESGRGNETLTFSRAIREGRERLVSGGELPGQHRVYSYVERGFYAAQLDQAFALFPAEQILLLRQQDLLASHADTLDRICRFLGVPHFAPHPAADEIFSFADAGYGTMPDEDRRYLQGVYAQDLARLADRYGMVFDAHKA